VADAGFEDGREVGAAADAMGLGEGIGRLGHTRNVKSRAALHPETPVRLPFCRERARMVHRGLA
jgi:hypothetical protein